MSQRIFKIWGWRERILETDTFVIDRLFLNKDSHSSWHYHNKKNNFFYITKGLVKIKEERGEVILGPGESIIATPDYKHQFRALEHSEMIEVAWVNQGTLDELDIIRLIQGGKVINNKDITEDAIRKQ